MREVHLSTMIPRDYLGLSEFEDREFIHARHTQINWETGWNRILQFGLYQKGPDVSEVGASWLANLSDRNMLRAFDEAEVQSFGEAEGFIDAAASDVVQGSSFISVPLNVDTRLIHYRRDLLAKAGVCEETAFESPEALVETLTRLRESGIPYPLAMATGGLSVHNLACFVWGRGGHFRSTDLHKVALVEPEARQGMLDFFKLHSFIHPGSRGMDYRSSDEMYYSGQAAVNLSGQWVITRLEEKTGISSEVLENTAHQLPPGVPYVGSTHLVIWRYSTRVPDALKVIKHLQDQKTLRRIFHSAGVFPARNDLLNQPPFSTDPRYQVVVSCLRKGRNFRSSNAWAGVEVRLNEMCDQLWADLFKNPELDLEQEIDRRVRQLAERVEKTILANW